MTDSQWTSRIGADKFDLYALIFPNIEFAIIFTGFKNFSNYSLKHTRTKEKIYKSGRPVFHSFYILGLGKRCN